MMISRLTRIDSPRRLTLALLALAAIGAPQAAHAQREERPLAELAFMAGCWRGDVGVDRTVEEHWTAADSDVMLATTRFLDGNTGRTRAWEFSRVVADSAGIILLPAPNGEVAGEFRVTRATGGEAWFENPAHDFPKRIVYRRVEEGWLLVRLDGGHGGGGVEEEVEFRLQRVPCPAGPPP